MTPRKRRRKYVEMAMRIAAQHGLPLDPADWQQVWALLDRHGKPTQLYAIADRSAQQIKFGRAESPGERLKALQTGSSAALELWGYCPESDEINERSVHAELAAHRTHGEWFAMGPETMAVVHRIRSQA